MTYPPPSRSMPHDYERIHKDRLHRVKCGQISIQERPDLDTPSEISSTNTITWGRIYFEKSFLGFL